MGTLLFDLRYGLRMLARNPCFTVVAVLTLALGIGANTAIFSVVNTVLLKPLAISNPSQVVYLEEQWKGAYPGLSVGNFIDIQRQSSSYVSLCASKNAGFNLATPEAPERVQGEYATADYFGTFGVQPLAGRVYTADEDAPGRAHVVVVSERLWRKHLQGDPAALGQQLKINGAPFTVIGVMPKSFDPLLLKSDIWIPVAFTSQQLADHDDHYLSVMGRLKPGVTLAQAQSELNVIAQRLQQQYPLDDQDRGYHATPLSTSLLGEQRTALRMLLGAVGFVLLIACANIANLQLARARGRQKEIAVRAALGASPRRIVRQLLSENLSLGLASGAVGVFLAYWGLSLIAAYGPARIPRLDQATVDPRTLVFALVVTLFSSLLFGLVPALRSASPHLSEAFAESGATARGSRDPIRAALVVGEVALALILMAGAGLLIRSALAVSHLDPGFDASNLVVGRVGLPEAAYHDPAVARQTFERMALAAAALPGAESAGVVSRAPLTQGWSSNGLVPEGKPFDMTSVVDSQLQIVSPGYLPTARIPLKAGHEFSDLDTRDKALVAIINETLARTLWPGENPIGKRFACCESGPQGRRDPVWHQVVGVVGDVRAWGLARKVQPQFYIPMAQMPPAAWDWIGRTMDLVVRTHDGVFPAGDLRTAVASIAPGVPLYNLSTERQKISSTLEESHFDTFLLSVFAALALALSSVGIYGVLSYIVAQRTRHIGIRMALGATPTKVLRDILAYGMFLAGAGLLLGLGGAALSTRLLSSLLYGVKPADPLIFVLISLLLIAVALLACYVPARRATQIDPMEALRYE